jgi:hypothetical protein
MGRTEHVPPFIIEPPGGNGGSLSPEVRQDVQNMVAEEVAAIAGFNQSLQVVLKRQYPSNTVYRELVMKKILQSANTLPIPDWYKYSWEQLETFFGDKAALVRIALSEMK